MYIFVYEYQIYQNKYTQLYIKIVICTINNVWWYTLVQFKVSYVTFNDN